MLPLSPLSPLLVIIIHTVMHRIMPSGNNLGNECVTAILSTLSEPEAPPIRQMDLSTNTRLNWRVAMPIASALGLESPPKDENPEEPSAPLPSQPIVMLRLSRLIMSGVRLTDKGAIVIASALKSNKILKVEYNNAYKIGMLYLEVEPYLQVACSLLMMTFEC